MESPEEDVTVCLDNDVDKTVPVICGMGRTIRIYTKDLEIKKNYYIRPSVKLEGIGSGERTYIYGITGDDYTLAFSYPEPNESIKDNFYLENIEFTEDQLIWYNIEPQDDNCFVLRLLDKDKEAIELFAFWIWNIQHHMIDYEATCECAVYHCM